MIEKRLGYGQVEELIKEAQDELKHIDKINVLPNFELVLEFSGIGSTLNVLVYENSCPALLLWPTVSREKWTREEQENEVGEYWALRGI
ncbi:hypothetical protein RHGRI_007589 [Rhododendron griersonianum]|uniref:Uncharacterized protein n=1 Tax=Rhododendron griersonianum TaxID=479676 RepID=A0AAV6KZ67_9ERIC|nr:hypothetical protein RHGRI_007589 [Rhododendron griersonianum]